MRAARITREMALITLTTLVGACGGGGSMTSATPPPPSFTSVPQVRVSQASTFATGCDGVAVSGTLYTNTAAEPYLAVNPLSPMNLVTAWQQNRWSNGGAQGLNLAASFDGGMTWMLNSSVPFSRCTGGAPGNNGDYARATDVWITISPNGWTYTLSLSFTGDILAAGSSSGMLVARSKDGGATWGTPTALIADGATAFNDKGSITADSTDANYVYAVWDRLTGQTAGPSYFAVTSDGGDTWQAARSIFDPGPTNQTIGNQIVVAPGDVVVDIFTELDTGTGGAATALVRAIRSTDHGTSWSAPVTISNLAAVGTSDPQTRAPVRDGSELASVSVAANGVIYVVWQDSRFSGGQHDGIAMTHSADGGMSWSTPVQVNANHNVQAFTPTINVRVDGVIAVSYYDLRNDTSSGATLLTDCWMVTSHDDGVTFKETHLSGPFDLDLAPDSEGLFLGDYESLASTPTAFLPFYVQTDAGSQVRSDAFIAFPPASAAAQAAKASFRAAPAPAGTTLTSAARQRVMERIRLARAQRRGQPG